MNRYCFKDGAGEHAHYLNGEPLIGTSSVCKILAKPLTWWASGLAVQTFGCVDPKLLTKIKHGKATQKEISMHESALASFLHDLKMMALDDYITLIDKAYRAHSVKLQDSATAGLDLHAECERFVKWHMKSMTPGGSFPDQIQPFIKWTLANVKRFLWSEGHCYSSKYWLGGISDCGYEKVDGKFGILDFKSSKDVYPDQFWQCGGYDIEIAENGIFDRDGNHLYTLEKPIDEYAVLPFGAPKPEPKFYSDPAGARDVFLAMLLIYKKTPQP